MAESGVGRIIDNKYEILTSIGRGGMSNVWLARDRRLDKMWAVKEFKPSTISSQGMANRQAIIDEANFIKRLDHPAIPRVVDIVDTSSSIFVVMDFVDGTALNKVLRQQGTPFEQERVIEWGIQLCEVLEYLHNLNPPVVYRDMKPANIMLRGDDTLKLIDFGISMELLPSGPSDARVIGTKGYGAPEQVDKDVHKVIPVDTRADIYALGTTLYSLVTGRVPQVQRDAAGRVNVDFPMRPIREIDGHLSEGLEHIITKATQSNPMDRYQSASEMRYDLEHYKELTEEYRAIQQRKVDGLKRRVIAAGVALAVGILCIVASFVVRSTSYSSLVYEAELASREEQNVVANRDERTRTADASEAEELLTQAIEVDPAQIQTYETLVNLYEEDGIFTATEGERWSDIWQKHGRRLDGNPGLGKLGYDVGIMYLVYYDYADARSIFDERQSEAATGQAAVENATHSIRWFRMATANPGSLTPDELNTAERYVAIGEFYEGVAKANREGANSAKIYGEFWKTLEDAIIPKGSKSASIEDSEEIVRLRTYQVAFESVSSSTYLVGFRNARYTNDAGKEVPGVTKEQAVAMLDAVCNGTRRLEDWVNQYGDAGASLYKEITEGEKLARANIERVYAGALPQTATSDEGEK